MGSGPQAATADITTRAGVTYHNVGLTEVEPDGLVFVHGNGVARVPYEDLPANLQAKYHFDPTKVAEYRREVAAKKAAVEKAETQRKARAFWVTPAVRPTTNSAAGEPANPAAHIDRAEPLGPPLDGPQSDAWDTAAKIGLLALVALLALWIWRTTTRYRRWKRIGRESDVFLDLLERGGGLPAVAVDVALEEGEMAYYSAAASIYEPTAAHATDGVSGFRVARGAGIGSRGYAIGRRAWARFDRGRLIVTNRRILFTGSKGRNSISLGRIVSVAANRDSVEIAIGSFESSILASAPNPLILSTVLRLCCRQWEEEILTRDAQRAAGPSQANSSDSDSGRQQRPRDRPTPRPWRDRRISFEEISYGRILGLSGRVTFADIKRQYRQRMLECHPDKVKSLNPKVRSAAEEEAKKINAAYQFFSQKYAPTR